MWKVVGTFSKKINLRLLSVSKSNKEYSFFELKIFVWLCFFFQIIFVCWKELEFWSLPGSKWIESTRNFSLCCVKHFVLVFVAFTGFNINIKKKKYFLLIFTFYYFRDYFCFDILFMSLSVCSLKEQFSSFRVSLPWYYHRISKF